MESGKKCHCEINHLKSFRYDYWFSPETCEPMPLSSIILLKVHRLDLLWQSLPAAITSGYTPQLSVRNSSTFHLERRFINFDNVALSLPPHSQSMSSPVSLRYAFPIHNLFFWLYIVPHFIEFDENGITRRRFFLVCFCKCFFNPLQNSTRRNLNEPCYSTYWMSLGVQGYGHRLFLCRPATRSKPRKLQGARFALISLFSLNFSILYDFSWLTFRAWRFFVHVIL